jgi:hypothetical protein
MIALILATLALTGCGGGGGSSQSGGTKKDINDNKNITTMLLNKSYQIQKSDRIEKRSEDAVVKIEASINEDNTTATLQKGLAVIVR